jgi:phosphoribosylformylglycinamidine cyclo-ligase
LARLNAKVRFSLDGWPEPRGVYRWIARLGNLAPQELYQTFNMGIGFVAIVSPSRVKGALRRLRAAGYPDARLVGRVTRGRGVQLPNLGIEYSGYF